MELGKAAKEVPELKGLETVAVSSIKNACEDSRDPACNFAEHYFGVDLDGDGEVEDLADVDGDGDVDIDDIDEPGMLDPEDFEQDMPDSGPTAVDADGDGVDDALETGQRAPTAAEVEDGEAPTAAGQPGQPGQPGGQDDDDDAPAHPGQPGQPGHPGHPDQPGHEPEHEEPAHPAPGGGHAAPPQQPAAPDEE
ncbi:MAG: hypothetical protein U0165_01215 [Polyangiaceae bacterium]